MRSLSFHRILLTGNRYEIDLQDTGRSMCRSTAGLKNRNDKWPRSASSVVRSRVTILNPKIFRNYVLR